MSKVEGTELEVPSTYSIIFNTLILALIQFYEGFFRTVHYRKFSENSVYPRS